MRNANVVDEDEAKRRIVAIRDRTGAALAMEALKSESSEDVQHFLSGSISAEALGQIEYLATGQPSATLFQHLSQVCPSLRAIYLDEVHLCIVWRVAFWRKSSPGQKALHRVQAKFNKVDYLTPIEQWGTVFTGKEQVDYRQVEEDTRTLIMTGGMTLQRLLLSSTLLRTASRRSAKSITSVPLQPSPPPSRRGDGQEDVLPGQDHPPHSVVCRNP